MIRKIFIRFFIACLTLITLQSRVFAILPSGDDPQKVKYVFLFIGDGMGQAQVNLTQAYLAALEDRVGFEHLSFTRFPHVGFASTYAYSQFITCSAAAGTALATGHKTSNGRISMDPEGLLPYESIATKAKKEGYKVGIVTNVSIDHATPAAFYANQPGRDMYFEIGLDLAQSDFDFFAGGGFLVPDGGSIDSGAINVIDYAMQKGFNVVNTLEGFEGLTPSAGKTLVLSPMTASEASMPFSIDMAPTDITLADYTAKAISMLDNEKGFFLMVEGGKIDWVCHGNDAATVIHEVIAFDKAVEHAVLFYLKHPEETLIIVTADHETGGLALGNNTTRYNSYLALLKYQKSSAVELNNAISRLGVNNSGDPEAYFTKMMKFVETDIGLNSTHHNTLLSEEETASLKKVFMESVYGPGAEESEYGNYEAFINAAVQMLAEKAGISWGSSAHTFVNVPIYSMGQGAAKFSGYIDNTDIPKIIVELIQVK